MSATANKATVKIEKNVPMPAARATYPFADMKVGDSFAISSTPETAKTIQAAIRSSYYYYRKKNPEFKLTFRALDKEVRCWRVE